MQFYVMDTSYFCENRRLVYVSIMHVYVYVRGRGGGGNTNDFFVAPGGNTWCYSVADFKSEKQAAAVSRFKAIILCSQNDKTWNQYQRR